MIYLDGKKTIQTYGAKSSPQSSMHCNLKKVGSLFLSFNAMPVKLTKNSVMVSALGWRGLLNIFFITLQDIQCVLVRVLSYDLSTEFT